ncbi:N-acetyltransferase [Rapidithrix thailandica]|uniref:N-acetyltransferase n=1 Tax=Rapidithrix thailandica TaxID=413964 RepID=A0AAW9SH28_9BACT
MQNSIYKGDRNSEIIQLFAQTFTDSEGEKEGNAIGALVKKLLEITPKEDMRIFITTKGKEIIGGVIFSRMRFELSNINTWLLSPAAVATSAQGTGVGQSLIHYAHDFLKREGMQVMVTYGDINFYSKVGYRPITEDMIPSPLKLTYPEGWIAQSLEDGEIKPIQGKSYCVEALDNPVYW